MFERVGDPSGGVDDAFGGGLDEFDVAAGPVGDVGDRVLGGVDPGVRADEVGDAFRFDFHPRSRRAVFRIAGRIVEMHVGELVSERLRALRGLEVRPDGDGVSEPVGDSVGGCAVSVLQREAGGTDLFGESRSRAVRGSRHGAARA